MATQFPPRSKRTKRRTTTFSPVFAASSFTIRILGEVPENDDDLVPDVLGFLLLLDLRAVDLPLSGDHLGRDVLAPQGDGRRRGDLVREVFGELPEFRRVGDEVRLAVHLDQDADAAVVVHVGLDQPLGRFAAGAFVGLGRPLLAQQVDGLLQLTARRRQRPLAVHHPGARAGPELGHQLRWNLFHDRHAPHSS